MRRNEFKIGHELQNEAVTLCISDLLWWLPTSNGLHFLHHLQKKGCGQSCTQHVLVIGGISVFVACCVGGSKYRFVPQLVEVLYLGPRDTKKYHASDIQHSLATVTPHIAR